MGDQLGAVGGGGGGVGGASGDHVGREGEHLGTIWKAFGNHFWRVFQCFAGFLMLDIKSKRQLSIWRYFQRFFLGVHSWGGDWGGGGGGGGVIGCFPLFLLSAALREVYLV